MVDIQLIINRVDRVLNNRDHLFLLRKSRGIHKAECRFAGSSDEKRDLNRQLLLLALVQSYHPDDIRCGITMLEDSLLHARTHKQKRKVMYLLAVGYYRLGNYSKSTDLLAGCLEIKPGWCRPIILWELIDDRYKKERGYERLYTSATIVGLITGFIGSTTLFLDSTWVIEALIFNLFIKDYEKRVVNPSLPKTDSPLKVKEEMFLLAQRYYIRGNSIDLSRSSYLVDRCLEIDPEWKPAITLKRRITPASVKAYIGDRIMDGFYVAVAVFGSITLLSWSCN